MDANIFGGKRDTFNTHYDCHQPAPEKRIPRHYCSIYLLCKDGSLLIMRSSLTGHQIISAFYDGLADSVHAIYTSRFLNKFVNKGDKQIKSQY